MSVSYPALTNIIGGNTAGATAFISSGTMVLAGGNNITLSQNANSITISAGAGGAGSLNLSAGTTSQNLTNFVLSNSNGLSFGLNGSTITGSYTVPSVPAQTEYVFSNSNGVTFGTNASTVTASVQTNYLSSQSNQAISAANGSFTFQTASFANSNGVSFSTGTQGIFATVATNYLTSQSNQAFSAGGGSSTFQTLNFANSNGISFTNTNGSIAASYTVPSVPAQTNQTIGFFASSQTTAQSSSSTFDARSLTFRGAGIISVGASAGEIVISATGGGGGLTNVNLSAGTTSNNLSNFVFSNSNGVSFGLNGSTVTATVATNYLTSQSNQALSGSNGSLAFQTATFGNLNGLSFYTSNGSMVGSYSVPSVPAQTNQTLGLYAVSNTTLSTSGTVDARTLSFQGAGIASVGVSNGSVVISVPAGGGAGDGFNILAAGTQTANTTGTVLFSNSNGVTFGMSNNSVITASVNAGGGGGFTIEDFQNMNRLSINLISNVTATALTQRPIFFPVTIPGSLTQNVMQIEVSRATSGSNAFTVEAAIYTYVNSTQISRLASLQNVFSQTATASNSGLRRLQLTGWETAGTNLTPGHYIMMLYFSAANTASMNYSLRGMVTANPPLGIIGGGTDAYTTATSALVSTLGFGKFKGLYTATTASPPANVSFAQVQQWTTGANPYVYLGRT